MVLHPFNKEELKRLCFMIFLVAVMFCYYSSPCFASFESSLVSVKLKLTGIVLPLLSVIGIGFASLSFLTGNPEAKRHITYAVVGAIIGFGAQAIVDLISSLVQ